MASGGLGICFLGPVNSFFVCLFLSYRLSRCRAILPFDSYHARPSPSCTCSAVNSACACGPAGTGPRATELCHVLLLWSAGDARRNPHPCLMLGNVLVGKNGTKCKI
ncbi:hypothetical protein EV126DRAFT_155468 [Verticillium dahliae]|nr:hypothetical protein EV126DRAFT_155468 [Verticillium dahliae]